MKISQGRSGPTYDVISKNMNQITIDPGIAIHEYFVHVLLSKLMSFHNKIVPDLLTR